MHVRVCRECGEEYRPEVARCADCGGALEDRHLDENAGASLLPGVLPAPVPEPLGVEGETQRIFASERSADLEPLAERLGQAGIPFVVRGSMGGFELLVGDADVERAATELRPLLGTEETVTAEPLREAACPACGAALPPGAATCPDCGLAVGDESG